MDNIKNNLGYNISNLLNWAFFVNYYQSNDNYDKFEKAEHLCLFVDESRESILKFGKCLCTKAIYCQEFRNKFINEDKVIDYENGLSSNGFPNNHFGNLHTFYQHCMSKLGVKTLPGMHMSDVPTNHVSTYEHCKYQVFDICHICCYYICTEYVKHTYEVIKFVFSQHRIMNKEKIITV